MASPASEYDSFSPLLTMLLPTALLPVLDEGSREDGRGTVLVENVGNIVLSEGGEVLQCLLSFFFFFFFTYLQWISSRPQSLYPVHHPLLLPTSKWSALQI